MDILLLLRDISQTLTGPALIFAVVYMRQEIASIKQFIELAILKHSSECKKCES